MEEDAEEDEKSDEKAKTVIFVNVSSGKEASKKESFIN